MTSQPMQPKALVSATISPTPTYQINTVVAIGEKYLAPAGIVYNAAGEAEALPSLLECYKLHRGLTSNQYDSVVEQLTHLWHFSGVIGVVDGFRTVDGELVHVFITRDGSELPDGKPKQPKVLPEGTYEIWVEGHPRSYGAVKLGEAQGATFKEACIAFFKDDPEFDADKMWRAWGHLYDNEADARKHFG